jgi:mannosyltransferase OCH1-like enzyme
MGSIPRHPFFIRVIGELRGYNRHWLLPYITVMYSTGPLFLSVLWRQYAHGIPSNVANIRILIQKSEGGDDMRFFTKHLGNSWHAQDARMIIWVCSQLTCIWPVLTLPRCADPGLSLPWLLSSWLI